MQGINKMKKLFLIRHAKSDWSNPLLDDFDRGLNNRGLKDAPFMAKLLKDKNIIPDLIISSPALRTKLTLEFLLKELNYKNEIIYDKSIYEAPYLNLKEVVNKVEEQFDILFLVGHNPGLCDFVNFLCEESFENIPTCGIVEIDFNTNSWSDISKENSKLISFEYPKKYK
jgi:phosphohistidine phosphatase